ncbi:HAAS signaling domain-containing protein [Amycolatopsis albispora]|uniref:Uncharacterized protein n=1 Tax=Amycolatopsis albispora TaxID=1804986 RepID=A0A344KZG8_9PSEU|nr:hypothetical protein [Amycolatopsis albispora]AXB41192.1 hypothetical protein A4R43_00580 [Amycolatopsis albispora]
MTTVTHEAAAAWLERFDRAAAALPQPRRGELRQELVEHLEALIAEDPSDDELAAAVDRLGDPAEIVAAEGLPPVSPARARAALGLLLLPLTGVLYLAPALPPGPPSMALIVLASSTVLGLVLRAEASASTRALGVLGALAPPLAGLGGILDKVFQAGHLSTQAPGSPTQYALVTDSWVSVLGQLAMLLLGLGLPVLAGIRLRRREVPADTRLTLGGLVLLLTPAVGLATALLLSGSRLGTSVGTMLEVPLVIVALACAAVLLAAGALLLFPPGFPLLTKVLVALAVLSAPIGVALLAEHEVRPAGLVWETGAAPPASVPEPEPDNRTVHLGLGLLFTVALPLAAAQRTGALRR